MPASMRWLRVAEVMSLVPDSDLTVGGLAHAGQAFRQLALPVAGDARQADDLAGVDLQVDAAQGFGAAVAHGAQAFDRSEAAGRDHADAARAA